MVLHVVEVGEGTLELPAIDGLRRFAGVLEGDAEVGASSARRFGGLEVGGCVADLWEGVVVSVYCAVVWGCASGDRRVARGQCHSNMKSHDAADAVHTILSVVDGGPRWCRYRSSSVVVLEAIEIRSSVALAQ